MRIEAYNQIQQIYGVNKSRKTTGKSPVSSGRDGVTISSIGKDIQTAKNAVKNASDIREDKVAALKSKVQSGQYDVSGESFADKLMQKFNEAAAF